MISKGHKTCILGENKMALEDFLGVSPGIFISIAYKDCQTWHITVINKGLGLLLIIAFGRNTLVYSHPGNCSPYSYGQ